MADKGASDPAIFLGLVWLKAPQRRARRPRATDLSFRGAPRARTRNLRLGEASGVRLQAAHPVVDSGFFATRSPGM